jgi:glutathione S-transferase
MTGHIQPPMHFRNSIMRLVARLGEKNCSLYGHDAYETSRIDSFLDASLVFARDAQVYLLALREASITEETHARASVAFATFASGIEQALSAKRRFLVGESITLADICLVADLSLFMSERRHTPQLRQRDLALIFDDRKHADYPRAMAHLMRLADHPAFAPDVAPYLRGFGFYHEDAKQ